MINAEKWNNRYSSEEYYFGKEPNEFFRDEIKKLKAGKILFVGDGEGRNSVYAAKLGWEVFSLDISTAAKKKAEKLAEDNGVSIIYSVADALTFEYKESFYDAVAIIYFHVSKLDREEFSRKIIRSLKTDGSLIMIVYEISHLSNNSGGPSDPDYLYELSDFAEEFIDLDFKLFIKDNIKSIKNGSEQTSAVIKFVGTKSLDL